MTKECWLSLVTAINDRLPISFTEPVDTTKLPHYDKKKKLLLNPDGTIDKNRYVTSKHKHL